MASSTFLIILWVFPAMTVDASSTHQLFYKRCIRTPRTKHHCMKGELCPPCPRGRRALRAATNLEGPVIRTCPLRTDAPSSGGLRGGLRGELSVGGPGVAGSAELGPRVTPFLNSVLKGPRSGEGVKHVTEQLGTMPATRAGAGPDAGVWGAKGPPTGGDSGGGQRGRQGQGAVVDAH